MTSDTIYITGTTPEGKLLIGGLWRKHRQEGFPLDISLMLCREQGLLPDVVELFAEAMIHFELPSVREHAPELFTIKTTMQWMHLLQTLPYTDQFQAAQHILLDKRSKGMGHKQYGRSQLLAAKTRKP